MRTRQPPRLRRALGLTTIEYAAAGALLVVSVVFAFMQLGLALGINIDQLAVAVSGETGVDAGRAPAGVGNRGGDPGTGASGNPGNGNPGGGNAGGGNAGGGNGNGGGNAGGGNGNGGGNSGGMGGNGGGGGKGGK